MKKSIIKISCITVLAALFAASFSACAPDNKNNNAAQEAAKTPKKPAQLQEISNKNWERDMPSDIDTTVTLNEKEYHITAKALNFKEYTTSQNYEITINDTSVAYNTGEYFHIEYAYLADIDPDDDSVILFVLPWLDNSYNNMTAYKYSPSTGIEQLSFDLNGDGVKEPTLEPGKHCADFKVSADGTFSLITGSRSRGMWGLQRYFKLDENNVFVFEQQDKYEIKGWADGVNVLQTYDSVGSTPRVLTYEEAKINPGYCIDSEEEYQMLLQGYYHCEQSYGELQQGDYFKLVYDDNNGNVMFVTNQGREGWINVNDLGIDQRIRGRVGGHALVLAG